MIRVFENYVVTADENNFILGELKTRKGKDGQPVEYVSNISYHSNLTGALDNCIKISQRRYIRDHDISLPESIKAIDEINQHLEKILAQSIKEHLSV
ncbi:MAG TPA: hypothetical protein VHR42_07760 [Clostridia bacterium]|nr:hypothetical protein [Clostridia bacterium]